MDRNEAAHGLCEEQSDTSTGNSKTKNGCSDQAGSLGSTPALVGKADVGTLLSLECYYEGFMRKIHRNVTTCS